MSAPKIKADRVKELSITEGILPFALLGEDLGFQKFSFVMIVGDTCYYVALHKSSGEWETGIGTYSALNTLTRTTILTSSNSNSKVVFTAGEKNIFISPIAKSIEDIAYGGTGLSALGSANQVLSVKADLSGLEYRTLAALTLDALTDVVSPNPTDKNLLQYNFSSLQWETVPGPIGTVVGTTDIQTLTNKTLVTPLSNSLSAVPVASGAGNSLTIAAGSGVTSGAGANLILNPGEQAVTGGRGTVLIDGLTVGKGKGTTGGEYANTAFGFEALGSITTGYNNTAIGHQALKSNIGQAMQTAIGWNALKLNNGGSNTAVGDRALGSSVNGYGNTAVGFFALKNSEGQLNVAIGLYSAVNCGGNYNTTIGSYSGYTGVGNLETGIGNILVGYSAGMGSGNSAATNSIVIGYNGLGNGSNTTTIGNSSTTATYLYGTIAAVPVASGAGNSLTIKAGSGVTSGAGGSLILQAGLQATSGGDGSVTVQQVAGQTGSLLFVKSSANDNLLTLFNNGDITLQPRASASSSTVPVLSGIRPGGQAGWKLNDSGFKFNDPSNPDHFMTLGSGTTMLNGLRFNYDNSCTFAAGSNRDFGATLWTSNQGAGYPLLGRRFAFISSTVAAQSGVGSSLPGVGELFSFGVNGINYWPNIISLSSNVNDLAHTGAAELRINCTVASDITGIKYGFGRHMDGRVVGLRNTGNANLTIKNKNSGSYQNNRLITDTGFDHIVAPGNVSSLVYDLTANNGSTGISITNVSRTSNVATFTTSTEAFVRAAYTVVISGMSDASFNGTYISSSGNDSFSNGQLTFTLPNTGADLGTTAMSGLAIVMGGWRVAGFSSVGNYTNALTAMPVASGAGNSLTIAAGNGVGAFKGGDIILQPGAQGSSGGNGGVFTTGLLTVNNSTGSAQNTSANAKFFVLDSIGNYTINEWNGAVVSRAFITPRSYIEGQLGDIVSGSRLGFQNTGVPSPNTSATQMAVYFKYAMRGVMGLWGIPTAYAAESGGSFHFPSATTAIAANTNDLALPASAFQRLNCTAASSLTGIAPPTGGTHVDGRMIRVYNVGTANLTLVHNATSTAANRVFSATGADIVVPPKTVVDLTYDATDNGSGVAGWKPFAPGSVAANAITATSVTSGAGNSLTIAAGSGVTSGAGGSLILQAGIQATTGGDGRIILRRAAGQTSNLLEFQTSAGLNSGSIDQNGCLILMNRNNSSLSGIALVPSAGGTNNRIVSMFGGGNGGFDFYGGAFNGSSQIEGSNIAPLYMSISQGGDVAIGGFSTPSARLHVRGSYNGSPSNTKIVIVQGMTGQTQNLQEWQNSAGTALAFMDASGNFNAITKSFNIPHPTKEGGRLRYASLEGPENSVYVRGSIKGVNEVIIYLPEYWPTLVYEDSITVQTTAVGFAQPTLFVKEKSSSHIVLSADGPISVDYMICAERRDVPKLEVES